MFNELLTTFLEKLYRLLKLVRSQELERFDQLIKPVMADMKSIHQNYLDLFTRAKQHVQKGDLDQAIKFLETERTKLAPLRRSTIEIADELAEKSQLKRYRQLFHTIKDYFAGAARLQLTIETRGTYLTAILARLERAKVKQALGEDSELAQLTGELVHMIEVDISYTESSWRKIAQEYGKLLGETY